MRWRTLVLVLEAATFCVGLGGAAPEPSLREAARECGLLIGAAVRPAQLSEAAYASTLAHEFNMLEPEDALKWEVVHPERASFDFSQVDQIVDFATRHGMKVRGHTLVWHRQNPNWLTDGKFTSGELAEILESHIKTVVGHYRGRIFAWDVVNEGFDELRPGTLRSTIWRDQPGIGLAGNGNSYIEHCFRWAHEADPQALLFYNEAEAETVNPKSDAIYAMVRNFRQRAVPIDGVGFQMHIANLRADVTSISANIGRFTALGVQVHITEMDVALPVDADGNARAADLQRQAEIYRAVAQACLAPSRMHGDPDMGFHGQVFLDRVALEEDARGGAAVGSGLSSQAGIRGAAEGAGVGPALVVSELKTTLATDNCRAALGLDYASRPSTPYNVTNPWPHRIQFATKARPPAAGGS